MPHLPSSARSGVALIGVGDPARDRTIYATILLLVALGFALIMLAVWLLRNTRPDPDVLAPLERMGQRKWRRADPVWQRRHLDEVRPGGAEPLEPSSAPPAADAEFELGPQASGFDDLVVSSTAPGGATAGLSAPPPDAVPVDAPNAPAGEAEDAISGAPGPDELHGPDGSDGDEDGGDTDESEESSSDDEEDAEDAHDAQDSEDEEDAQDSEDSEDSEDEDEDEDDTGEQDTDDFLAVLSSTSDLDPHLATAPDEDHADEVHANEDVLDDDRADEEGVPG